MSDLPKGECDAEQALCQKEKEAKAPLMTEAVKSGNCERHPGKGMEFGVVVEAISVDDRTPPPEMEEGPAELVDNGNLGSVGDDRLEAGSGDDNVKAEVENGGDDEESLKDTKLQTISKYMALVENAKGHSYLLKESTVTGFLVLCLGDEVPEVVERSFEVFRALSKYQDNLPLIKKLDYIMDALRCVTSNTRIKEAVRKDARNIIMELKSVTSKEHAPLTELSESMKNVMVSTTTNGGATASATDSKDIKKSSDLNTTMSTMKRKNKGRETILLVENGVLQQRAERAKVTQVLIGVPGIISVTYDLKNNHCVIRGKRHVASEDFGRAVATLGLANVYLVRKNENKEEVKILIEASQQENMFYPLYPEEQENDEIDNSAAVAKKDQLPSDDASFFKSAKNFIKRSFYW